MRLAIAGAVSLLVLFTSAVVSAGNPSLCRDGGWATSQSGDGSSFSSQAECIRSNEVFRPTLTLSRTHVQDFDPFQVTGVGFHTKQEDESATLSFSATGSEPYLHIGVGLKRDGTFQHVMQFGPCAPGVSYDLTITLTDSSGVHASAQIILC